MFCFDAMVLLACRSLFVRVVVVLVIFVIVDVFINFIVNGIDCVMDVLDSWLMSFLKWSWL